MLLAIPFPNISPEIFSIDVFGITLALRWYALGYIAGFLLAWKYGVYLCNKSELWVEGKAPMQARDVEDLITYMVLGVIIGGRLGDIIFYRPYLILENPAEIIRIWNGGMAFHGGMLGVIAGWLLFCYNRKLPYLSTIDVIVISSTFGIGLVRIANFINGELWGRPTEMPWGVIFNDPRALDCGFILIEPCARHPSQLYEAFLEGFVLFCLLAYLLFKRNALHIPGQLSAWFLIGYGTARTIAEGYRTGDVLIPSPNNPYGHTIRFGVEVDSWGITMGQILSLPMIGAGLFMLYYVRSHALK